LNQLALCGALPLSDSTGPPEWVHLLPAGTVRTVDGRGPYSQGDARALIAASMAGGKLPLDENHSADRAAPRGDPSPARAWITALQSRADGIWGRVEWVEPSVPYWRMYRGISPAIVHNKAGHVLSIARASLINTPNLIGLTALHSQQPAANPALPSDALTGADLDHCRLMGIDPARYAVTLRAERERASPGLSLHAAQLGDAALIAGRDAGLDAADLDMCGKLGLDPKVYAAEVARWRVNKPDVS